MKETHGKIRLVPEPEIQEPEQKGMAHPLIVQEITIWNSAGIVVKQVNPREWPKYGWEVPCSAS